MSEAIITLPSDGNSIDFTANGDFGKDIDLPEATFKDIDMNYVKFDGNVFWQIHFINIINLDLTDREYWLVSFYNVNEAIGADASKILGHPNFAG